MCRTILLEPLSSMLDSSTLANHGDIITMFGLSGSACPSVFRTTEFEQAVGRWLKDHKFDPNNDSFVVAGRATKVAIALAAMVKLYGRIKVLLYDGHSNQYVERTIAG